MYHYKNNQLYIENVQCTTIVADFGTPVYVYSKKAINDAFGRYQSAFSELKPLICYAVKANSNLSILNYFAQLGAGFDIVSGGELLRVLKTVADPHKIIFSGVNKSEAEIELALNANIFCFNIESDSEIARIQKVAQKLNKIAPVSFRINPDVDAKTHPYISTGLKNNKFGIPYDASLKTYLYAKTQPNLKIIGIDCHIGSQLIDLKPLIESADKIFHLVDLLKKHGIELQHIDLGGGIGIEYHQEAIPDLHYYADSIATYFKQHPNVSLILEPGRSLIGNAGTLLTKVDFIKSNQYKNFIIVDAGMNDLLRPSLYQAHHEIIPVFLSAQNHQITADVVGPVCESGDYFAKNRLLNIQADEFLAIKSTGAYSASMASNYNSRLKIPEVLVDDSHHTLIRRRETFEQLIENELPILNFS